MTGPGTAIRRRRRSLACRAVLTAPLRWPASTTSVPVASAAITRLRTRNLSLLTCRPGGHSLTSTPWAAIASNSSAWAAGYGTSTPQASTATVTPSAPSAPRCAAASTPNAPPETTAQPRAATDAANSAAT